MKSLNQLEAEVEQRIHTERIQAELKVDGLFFDKLYADYMILVKSTELDKSVLDMSAHYLELKVFLEELSHHPEEIMNPEHHVFQSEPQLYDPLLKTNHRIHKTYKEIRRRLNESDSYDEKELYPRIQEASKAMVSKLTDYMKDYLPGGKYWEPSEDVKQILSKLKPHNDACESVLGMNDWLTTAFPKMSRQARSALIEVANNQTIEWLKMQLPDCQEEIIALATTKRHEIAKERRLHEERLKQQQITQREKEMQKCTEKANKEVQDRQHLEQGVLYQTVKLMKLLMIFMPCQYLKQPDEDARTNQNSDQDSFQTPATKGCSKHQVYSQQKTTNRRISKRLEVQIVQQVPTDESQVSRHRLRENPQLVKKRIKHKFFDDDTGSEQWYEGYVLSFSKSAQVYTVKYDGEDSTHSFQLDEFLEDISKDLFVL